MRLILIIVLVGGLGCVLAAAGQLWAIFGGIDDPVGRRRPREPAPPAPSTVPGAFRALVQAEAGQWKRQDQWAFLHQRLNEVEAELGGTPDAEAPETFSAEWLDRRLTQLEAMAGPLPAPLRPTPTPVETSRLPWKKT